MEGENVDAWYYMIQKNGNERCMIAEGSVHNELIERLWSNVHCAVLSQFKELFIRLERERIMDVDHIDLFVCMKFSRATLTRLSEFLTSWNSHSITTQHSMVPMQLFIVGREIDELTSDSEEDGNQLQAHDTIYAVATEAVEVSNLRFRPCTSLKSEIEAVAQLPSPVTDSTVLLYNSYPLLGERS